MSYFEFASVCEGSHGNPLPGNTGVVVLNHPAAAWLLAAPLPAHRSAPTARTPPRSGHRVAVRVPVPLLAQLGDLGYPGRRLPVACHGETVPGAGRSRRVEMPLRASVSLAPELPTQSPLASPVRRSTEPLGASNEPSDRLGNLREARGDFSRGAGKHRKGAIPPLVKSCAISHIPECGRSPDPTVRDSDACLSTHTWVDLRLYAHDRE